MKKNVTFNDIAKYTGFSKTTISRYFNHPESVLPANRDIIQDALIKLDYKENKVAKVLASGETEFIGIIIPDLYHQFYAEVLSALLATHSSYGYKFLIFNGDKNQQTEAEYIAELMAYKIQGLVVMSHTTPSIELSKLSIPVVAIEREDSNISSVNADNYDGACNATNKLIDSGCEVMIHINSYVKDDQPSYKRITGFVDTCTQRNMKHEVFYLSEDRSFEHSKENMQRVFKDIEDKYSGLKKGVFVSSDTYANMFLNNILRKYHDLPEEYEIIGFDNTSVSRDAVIPITTVGQRIDIMARETLEILSAKIHASSDNDEIEHRVVPTEFIERSTSGAKKAELL